jgi:hypothetical protein
MKSIQKIFLACLAVTAFSCGNDDDNNAIDASSLVKKWYYVSEKVAGETIPYDDHESCGRDYTEFLSNGTANEVDVFGCEIFTDTFSYAVNGNQLTVSTFGFSETVTITKLTATALELQSTYDYDDDGDTEVVTVVYTAN